MKKSLTLWSILIVLTGTYFRTKSGQDVDTKEIDFLIIAQIMVSLAGAALGGIIVLKERKIGPSTIGLAVFLLFVLFSAFLTPLTTKVLGYAILLIGASFLTLAMVSKAEKPIDLELIERTWLTLIILITIKDSLISILIPGLANEWSADRLGMGVTHANTIGFYSAISFWMLHRQRKYWFPAFLWLVRIFLIAVMILAKSRISMLTFLVGGFVTLIMNFSDNRETLLLRRVFVTSAGLLALFSLALLYFLDVEVIRNLFAGFNRGQNLGEIATLTGRTEIWRLAFHFISDGLFNFLFGHGYGVSSFLLNSSNQSPLWYAYHSHNDFIEILLNVGLAGFLVFLFLQLRSFTWLVRYSRLAKSFGPHLSTRAAAVVSMVFFYSFTEVNLGAKIDPIVMIGLFYLLSLDRHREWSQISAEETSDSVHE